MCHSKTCGHPSELAAIGRWPVFPMVAVMERWLDYTGQGYGQEVLLCKDS